MDLITKAKKFAKEKHGNDTRKFSNKFYYTHPFSVADRLKKFKKVKNNENILAAAYLHDTLEDTETTSKELRREFNEKIANLVIELTSDKENYKNNEDRTDHLAKAKYLTDRINNMSRDARLIKLADREHNVSDIPNASESFIKRYMEETHYILEHLQFKPNKEEKALIDSIRNKIQPYLSK
jgi:guanosine-3',5'-bis(diphosphate) 3'-pyrophosphohydrolase